MEQSLRAHLVLIPGGRHASTEHARLRTTSARTLLSGQPATSDDDARDPNEYLEADPDLQDLIACWASLAPARREVVMQVAGFLPLATRRELNVRFNREVLRLFVRRPGEVAP